MDIEVHGQGIIAISEGWAVGDGKRESIQVEG